MQGEVLQRQRDYWRAQLGGAPDILELPADHVRPHFGSTRRVWRCARLRPRAERGLARYCGVNPVPDGTDQISVIAAPIGRTIMAKKSKAKKKSGKKKAAPARKKKKTVKSAAKKTAKKAPKKAAKKAAKKVVAKAAPKRKAPAKKPAMPAPAPAAEPAPAPAWTPPVSSGFGGDHT